MRAQVARGATGLADVAGVPQNGDMTVASPTTGLAVPRLDAVPRLRCTSCGTPAAGPEPYCAHCGALVAIPVATGLASAAATRSLRLAILVVVANLLVGGATFGVVYLVADAARLSEAALGLEALRFAIVGALVVLAVRAGVHGLRETAGGRLARRGRAIAGIVVASFFGLLVTLSLVATAVLALAL